jgi:glycosyltransferase involved in cell wall biosynthesis
VLFVESRTELSGPQIALLTMLRSVDRGAIEPYYASLEFGRGELPSKVEELGIPVFRLPAGRFREIGKSIQKAAALRRIVRENEIGVVFSNSAHALLYARPVALLTGRPCVWWVHGHFPGDRFRPHAISYAHLFLSADAFFTNSEHTARVISVDYPTAGEIRVVRYGIDLRELAPNGSKAFTLRQSLGISAEDPIVAMFGRLHPFKGQDVFLRAAALVVSQGVTARFVLVGSALMDLETGYAQKLREFVRNAGLEEKVLFLGERRDISNLMNASDVLVHASIEPEPWGLVVAEGMAAGRPVIATAAGGPLEMIDDGRTGLLVPPGDPVALAGAITSLLKNPGWRQQMGQAARRHAEQHFDSYQAATVLCRELLRVGRHTSDRENGLSRVATDRT